MSSTRFVRGQALSLLTCCTLLAACSGSGTDPAPGDSPPAAPSGLTATARSATQIGLAWTDGSTDEDGFQVERREGSGAWSPFATLGAGVVTHEDATCAASTTYAYRVRAFNAAGTSAWSAERSATTPAPPIAVPGAPSALSATAVSSTRVDLAWTAGSADESGFSIERTTGAAAFAEIATVAAGVTTYADEGCVAATPYEYRVRGWNGGGFGGYSPVALGTTPATPVAPPSGSPAGLTATAASPTQIDLAWSWSGAGAEGFKVERLAEGGTIWLLRATLGASARTYADTSCPSNTAFTYRVWAINSAGAGPLSAEASARTLPDPAVLPPDAPTLTGVSSPAWWQINLEWDSTLRTRGYRVLRGPTLIDLIVFAPYVHDTFFYDGSLAAATTYCYGVQAIGWGGDSPITTACQTTRPYPPAPAAWAPPGEPR